ncbi:MAG: ATP-binding protein [Christensenellaceae bacterium]|nr:ATP-binding protein [Christensenellaceae bacterium]
MFELSLHILDLAQNSISAGATLVTIEIAIGRLPGLLVIALIDDGCGMDEALLARVTSPFGTTRKSRKVGLGIPMFMQLAELCGGGLTLESTPGLGTRLVARFELNSIDLPPMGDLSATMRSLILGVPDRPDFVLDYRVGEHAFRFDTREIRQALDGVALNEPAVLSWIGEYIAEGLGAADEAARRK